MIRGRYFNRGIDENILLSYLKNYKSSFPGGVVGQGSSSDCRAISPTSHNHVSKHPGKYAMTLTEMEQAGAKQ